MTLMKCPECGKEISDKAKYCPQCGYPIEEYDSVNIYKNLPLDKSINFPDLPAVIDIGHPIKYEQPLVGYFCNSDNVSTPLREGKVLLYLHPNGIRFRQDSAVGFLLSNQQIVNLSSTTQKKIVSEGKSVIGRAAVGGLLLEPVGALIGGLSGTGSNSRLVGQYYLVVSFWDVRARKLQTLLISTKDDPVGFISRHRKIDSEQQGPTDSYYIIVNILNNDLSLNKERAVEAVRQVGKNRVITSLCYCGGRSPQVARSEIRHLIENAGLTKEEVQGRKKEPTYWQAWLFLALVFLIIILLVANYLID